VTSVDDRAPVIKTAGLSRIYDSFAGPVTALVSATFSVHAGEMVALIGPSGSGKSTLMNLLGLLDRPTAGDYHLNNKDTSSLDEKERTRLRSHTIGFVFQAFHLVGHKTVTANVALPLMYTRHARSVRRPLSEEALARVGLSHRLQAMPHTLSGGEKQRVAIARATVHRPRLLLCDEPTGNLDTVTSKTVMRILADLSSEGLAIVVVTHDREVAELADRMLVVADGRLSDHASA
jgi:putative ABC transport system ATP-binding protein